MDWLRRARGEWLSWFVLHDDAIPGEWRRRICAAPQFAAVVVLWPSPPGGDVVLSKYLHSH
jgi:hypothetical protein